LKDNAPQNVMDPLTGKFLYGRYREPFEIFDYSGARGSYLSQWTTLKKWLFISTTTDKFYFAAAVVDLNYAGNFFAYYIDRKTHKKYEFTSISPLARSIKQFDNTPKGCVEWSEENGKALICYNSESRAYQMEIRAMMSNSEEVKDVFMAGSMHWVDSMNMLFPIEPYRPACTIKQMGMRVVGIIRTEGGKPDEFKGFGSFDWTYSLAERVSVWKWASMYQLVTKEDPATVIGINLSDHVYVDKNNVSQENAVWVNGEVAIVGKVIFEFPTVNPDTSTSKIYTVNKKENVSLNLIFTPRGKRSEVLDAVILVSNFVQYYGEFSGTISVKTAGGIRKFEIEKAYGVVENHYAKW